jgi:hypothetical protein
MECGSIAQSSELHLADAGVGGPEKAADSWFDIPVHMVTEPSRFYRPFGADLFLLSIPGVKTPGSVLLSLSG